MIFIILIYVDDLLIFATALEMEILRALLTEAFKSITMEVDQKLSYLGMQIVWSDAGFDISMEHYVKQLLGDWPNVLLRTGLGTKDTFKLDVLSPALAEKPRQLFHTTVARILYLVKRIRTDALTVTSFLCTRVTKATEEDQSKLERLLGYLKASQGRKLQIRVTGPGSMQIRAFVDAAFALHFDAKLHTGCVVTVGGAVV
jgi:hypothetical protein